MIKKQTSIKKFVISISFHSYFKCDVDHNGGLDYSVFDLLE